MPLGPTRYDSGSIHYYLSTNGGSIQGFCRRACRKRRRHAERSSPLSCKRLVLSFKSGKPKPFDDLRRDLNHSRNSSLSRRVCTRLTGISLFFLSFMRNW